MKRTCTHRKQARCRAQDQGYSQLITLPLSMGVIVVFLLLTSDYGASGAGSARIQPQLHSAPGAQ